MDNFFENLAKEIITKEDLVFFLNQISAAQNLIFQNINTPLSEKVKEKISQEFGKELENLERKGLISKSPEANRVFFEKLKKHLQNIPQIKITVAFRPKEKLIEKISLWLEKEIGQKVILDIIFSRTIGGGAIVEFQGRQANYSLAREIDKIQK